MVEATCQVGLPPAVRQLSLTRRDNAVQQKKPPARPQRKKPIVVRLKKPPKEQQRKPPQEKPLKTLLDKLPSRKLLVRQLKSKLAELQSKMLKLVERLKKPVE